MSIKPIVDFLTSAVSGFFNILGSLTFSIPFGNGEISISLFDMLLAALFMIILFKGIRLIAGKDTSSGD